MKIHLTKNQLERVIAESVNIHYSREQIPQLIKEISVIVVEGKKVITATFNNLKSLTISEILERPDEVEQQILHLKKLQNEYEQKFNKYFDIHDNIHNTYYDIDSDNKDIWELDKWVNKLDYIQTDLNDVLTMTEDIFEVFVSGGQIKDKIEYLQKQYPTQTIDISHQLPNN